MGWVGGRATYNLYVEIKHRSCRTANLKLTESLLSNQGTFPVTDYPFRGNPGRQAHADKGRWGKVPARSKLTISKFLRNDD